VIRRLAVLFSQIARLHGLLDTRYECMRRAEYLNTVRVCRKRQDRVPLLSLLPHSTLKLDEIRRAIDRFAGTSIVTLQQSVREGLQWGVCVSQMRLHAHARQQAAVLDLGAASVDRYSPFRSSSCRTRARANQVGRECGNAAMIAVVMCWMDSHK
jgi:hypothetical protein